MSRRKTKIAKLERDRLNQWKKRHIDPSLSPRSYGLPVAEVSSRSTKSPRAAKSAPLFEGLKKLLKRRAKRQKPRISAQTKLKAALADSQRLYSERRRERRTI